jgi:hypothetical protein
MSGNYPPGSPAEWLPEGYVTCNIQCHGGCDRLVDVRLDTLPQDCSWSQVGERLVCKNVAPHDRAGHTVPFTRYWKT